jgi:thiamine biosynthesis protein ThiS
MPKGVENHTHDFSHFQPDSGVILHAMRDTVNGREHDLPSPCTMAQLLTILGMDGARIAVECNHDVVPRATYAHMTLAEGDRLEIVGFIGGGS